MKRLLLSLREDQIEYLQRKKLETGAPIAEIIRRIIDKSKQEEEEEEDADQEDKV